MDFSLPQWGDRTRGAADSKRAVGGWNERWAENKGLVIIFSVNFHIYHIYRRIQIVLFSPLLLARAGVTEAFRLRPSHAAGIDRHGPE